MAKLSTYDIPFDEIESKIISWMEEAVELRHGDADDPEGKVGLPEYELGYSTLLNSFRRVRQRLDRVEELQNKITQIRSRLVRMQESAKLEAAIAYDEAAQKNKQRRYAEDFSSGKERHAEASLETLDQQRTAAAAARKVSISNEVYEVINRCFWGLDGLRKDHMIMIRAMDPYQTSLENTTGELS